MKVFRKEKFLEDLRAMGRREEAFLYEQRTKRGL